jgi:uncharacterized membrane protein HdeD (DUF308 family)
VVATEATPSRLRGDVLGAWVRDLSGLWWVFLITGILWILFGMFVLSYRVGSLLALAVFVGVTLLFGGVNQIATALRAPSWRWLFLIAGVLSIIAGIITLAWPGRTLFVISVFLSWYLVFVGIAHVVGALVGPKHDWWWTMLLLGIVEFLLGAWAAGYPGRSLLVFVNLVGVYALFHGVGEIFAAFALRDADRELGRRRGRMTTESLAGGDARRPGPA